MKRFATGSGWVRCRRAGGLTATVMLVAAGALVGSPTAGAIDRPTIDPAALPPDGPPGPEQPMRQTSYCTEVGVLPGTDFRVQPKFLDMMNLSEAWQFGRGGGVKVAVIDTGVSPHPRLPNLVGGGDYVMEGGDGLSDCDAHGTLVASLIAGAPANGTPLPPPRQTRRPPSLPTTEPTPTPPPPQTTIIMQPPPPAPPPPPPPEGAPPPGEGAPFPPPVPGPAPAPAPAPGPPPAQAPGAGNHSRGTVTMPSYSGGGRIVGINSPLPSAPPPPGPPSDAFTGVAPDVEVISIRQSSQAFGPKDPFVDEGDPQARQKADNIRTMARAIVHAANMGAQVINISDVVCMGARTIIPQPELGAAVRYAAVEKDAVIVVAAGDTTKRDCKQNPAYDPLRPNDPRDWNGVTTVVTPSWFDEFVLTVGAVDSSGAPQEKSSVAGPWVSLAAPGTDIEGLSPRDDGLMNAVDGPDNSLLVPSGTSFSAALVSGAAALVRAKYPDLSSYQVRNRLIHTARPPARGVDNQVGYGIVDPVAALTWDVPEGPASPPERLSAPLELPPPPPDRNMVPVWAAAAGLATVLLGAAVMFGGAKMVRRSSGQR